MRCNGPFVQSIPMQSRKNSPGIDHTTHVCPALTHVIAPVYASHFEHLTPKLKRYIFQQINEKNVMSWELEVQSYSIWVSYEKPSSLYCVMIYFWIGCRRIWNWSHLVPLCMACFRSCFLSFNLSSSRRSTWEVTQQAKNNRDELFPTHMSTSELTIRHEDLQRWPFCDWQ